MNFETDGDEVLHEVSCRIPRTTVTKAHKDNLEGDIFAQLAIDQAFDSVLQVRFAEIDEKAKL